MGHTGRERCHPTAFCVPARHRLPGISRADEVLDHVNPRRLGHLRDVALCRPTAEVPPVIKGRPQPPNRHQPRQPQSCRPFTKTSTTGRSGPIDCTTTPALDQPWQRSAPWRRSEVSRRRGGAQGQTGLPALGRAPTPVVYARPQLQAQGADSHYRRWVCRSPLFACWVSPVHL